MKSFKYLFFLKKESKLELIFRKDYPLEGTQRLGSWGPDLNLIKITKGFVDYGHTMFRNSRSGRNLLHTPSSSFGKNGDLF